MNRPWRGQLFWPVVLVLTGVYFLLRNLGFLDWIRPEVLWPIVLIVLGVWLIAGRVRT